MTLSSGSKIVTKGLVFAFDMPQSRGVYSKSWKGRPTTNWIWHQNPRIDTSYSSYSATASGTWNQHHNEAITVYNKANSNITAYNNTGVTDWTNTYHAHWVLDPELGRPVVIMRNYDGTWKAKSYGVGKTKAEMDLAVGDIYTISWLQWTDNTARSAYVGLYSSNGTSNNFHDGIAFAYNSKVATWQRVSKTFTVSNNGLTYPTSIYMYGHYGVAGVLKIADVQLEKGGPSTFISGNSDATSTRSSTTSLLDWAGGNTITATSLTYENDGTFSFNGSSNYLDGDLASATNMYCLDLWFYNNNTIPNNNSSIGGPSTYQTMINFNRGTSTTPGVNLGGWTTEATNEAIHIWGNTNGTGSAYNGITYTTAAVSVGWHHVAFNWNGSYYDIWVDGVKSTVYSGSTIGHAQFTVLNSFRLCRNNTGTYYFNGKIAACKIYQTQLTDAQVIQNFNALRGRYGI